MTDTLFTKIIAGEIPCHKVYEDHKVFAFLDIAPLSRGHTLVIPKEPAPTLDQLGEESAAAVGRALPKIARAVMQATGTKDYNILQNNGPPAHQAVHHMHFHIIPKPNTEEGLEIHWPAGHLDDADGVKLADAIRGGFK